MLLVSTHIHRAFTSRPPHNFLGLPNQRRRLCHSSGYPAQPTVTAPVMGHASTGLVVSCVDALQLCFVFGEPCFARIETSLFGCQEHPTRIPPPPPAYYARGWTHMNSRRSFHSCLFVFSNTFVILRPSSPRLCRLVLQELLSAPRSGARSTSSESGIAGHVSAARSSICPCDQFSQSGLSHARDSNRPRVIYACHAQSHAMRIIHGPYAVSPAPSRDVQTANNNPECAYDGGDVSGLRETCQPRNAALSLLV